MSTTSSDQSDGRRSKNPFSWIPTLYFAEGVPCMVVTAVSVVMLKSLGMSNADLAFWTSWLALPWIFKPLWTPIVDLYGSKRLWIVATQFAMAGAFALAAFAMPLSCAAQAILGVFMLLAFLSATHDASADGFYMLALDSHSQAAFSGVRSAFYRCAMIAAQGGLVMLAGFVEAHSGLQPSRFEIPVGIGSTFAPIVYNAQPSRLNGPEILCSVQGDPSVSGESIEDKELFKSLKGCVADWNAGKAGAINPASVPTPSGALLVHVRFQDAVPLDKGRQVSISRVSGGKSVFVAEGEILRFDKPGQTKYSLVKVDPKLKRPVNAVFEARSGDIRLSWALCMGLAAAIFGALGLYHLFFLPRPEAGVSSRAAGAAASAITEFFAIFLEFFKKRGVWLVLAYILLYRFAESQLLKLFAPFMLDPRSAGGLAMSISEQGFIYGTVGIVCLMAGGIFGGLAIARYGLGLWLLPMCLIMNTPDLLFVYLSQVQPDGLLPVAVCVAIEQLGYGFGFTAFMLVMVQFAEDSGAYKTSHYAIMTGFMALGMMLPGMFAGKLQEQLGYKSFFLWVLICVVPSVIVTLLVKRVIRRDFGIAAK